MQTSGAPLIVAAVILGAAIVIGSMLVKGSLDQGTEELGAVRTALADVGKAVKEGAPAPAPQPARPNRPDPNKRYDVSTEGAPAIGPKTAKVEIVEFSDFQ